MMIREMFIIKFKASLEHDDVLWLAHVERIWLVNSLLTDKSRIVHTHARVKDYQRENDRGKTRVPVSAFLKSVTQ